jgi:hypothetical protein
VSDGLVAAWIDHLLIEKSPVDLLPQEGQALVGSCRTWAKAVSPSVAHDFLAVVRTSGDVERWAAHMDNVAKRAEKRTKREGDRRAPTARELQKALEGLEPTTLAGPWAAHLKDLKRPPTVTEEALRQALLSGEALGDVAVRLLRAAIGHAIRKAVLRNRDRG